MVGCFVIFTWSYFSTMIISGINKVLSVLFPTPISPVSPVDPVTPITPVDSGIEPIITHFNNLLGNILSHVGEFLNIPVLNDAVEYGFARVDTIISVGGLYIVLYGIFILAGCLLLFRYWNDGQYFWFKVLYFSSCIMFVLMIVAIFGNMTGGPIRFRYPLYFLAVLSSGLILHNIYMKITADNSKRTVVRVGSVILILSLICSLGVSSYYPSPNTLNGGYQTTQTELTGAETLLPLIEYDYSSTTGVHFKGMQRYVTALYNHLSLPYRDDTDYDAGLPYHFGYDTGASSLAESIRDGEKYVIVTEKDHDYYQAYYPQMMQHRYEPEDYEHLSVDSSLHYVYDNGGFGVYDVFLNLHFK